jgi:hypothetical protein
MYSYASQFFGGSLDPTWPHVILIAGSIVGGALVGLGVILEAPKIFSVPVAAVFIGVIIEAACTLLLFGFDEGISQSQQNRIASLDQQLLQIRFPRSLNFEKFKAGIDGIPPQDFEALYDANAPDAENLSTLIWITLRQAGWRTVQKAPAPLAPRPGPDDLRDVWQLFPLTEQAGGGPWGLSVVTHGPLSPTPDKGPAGMLTLALSQSLVGPPAVTTEGADLTMPPGIIRIIVGPKLP